MLQQKANVATDVYAPNLDGITSLAFGDTAWGFSDFGHQCFHN